MSDSDANPAQNVPKPPTGLSTRARDFWREVVRDYAADDEWEAYEYELLGLACECLTTAEQARKALRKHGLTYESLHGSPVARPEVQIHRTAVGRFQAIVRQLGLGDAEEETPAPGARRGKSYTSTMRRRAGGTAASVQTTSELIWDEDDE